MPTISPVWRGLYVFLWIVTVWCAIGFAALSRSSSADPSFPVVKATTGLAVVVGLSGLLMATPRLRDQ
jgi:hypothetical protein